MISKTTFTSFLFLFLFVTSAFSQEYDSIKTIIKDFDEIIYDLSNYAKKYEIRLTPKEDIKDVLSFGYIAYLNRHRKDGYELFSYLSMKDKERESVAKETFHFLSILCWFPFIPHDNFSENELKSLRSILTKDYYKRFLYYNFISTNFQKEVKTNFQELFKALEKKKITFGELVNEQAVREYILPENK